MPSFSLNTSDSSFTGHVNITVTDDNGVSTTYGANTGQTADGFFRGGVAFENDKPMKMGVCHIISVQQFNILKGYLDRRVADTNAGYALIFENCADLIINGLKIAGITIDPSSLTSAASLPVHAYTVVSKFLHDNGAGPIIKLVGDTLENMGGFGNAVANAAIGAWGLVQQGNLAGAGKFLIEGIANASVAIVGDLLQGIGDAVAAIGEWFQSITGTGDDDEPPVHSSQPVVLDLDGDGVELVTAFEGEIYFEGQSGVLRRYSWVDSDDGILVFDANGDGRASGPAEFELTRYAPGAVSDLDALAAFDSTGDGVFDSADEAFHRFLVWQDIDGDGLHDDGESRSLAEVGVVSINLALNGHMFTSGGSLVHNTTTWTDAGGDEHAAWDVTFLGQNPSYVPIDDWFTR